MSGNGEFGHERFWVQRRQPGRRWRTVEDFPYEDGAMDFIKRERRGLVVEFQTELDGGTVAPDPGAIVIDYRWLAVAIVVASIVYKFVIKGL